MSEPALLPAGEGAVMVDYGGVIAPEVNDRVRRLHRRLQAERPPGFRESIPAFSSVLVYFDPLAPDPAEFLEALAGLVREAGEGPLRPGRLLEVPAVYGKEFGPDLAEVAARAGLREDEAAAVHAGQTYRVYMIGFLVGFPYLAPVPDRIATPRRVDPRLEVPAGSIGIAGRQTGVYPIAAPGGWQLVARTQACLWDPARHPPAALQPGDRVRFRALPPAGFGTGSADLPWPEGEAAHPVSRASGSGREVLRVLAGGLLTTIQDRGRPGYQEYGVPPGGALDDVSLRVANRLVGNAESAAALEVTGGGLRVEALDRVRVALAGADLDARVNEDAFLPSCQRVLQPGDRLSFGSPRQGLRSYLAVAGGVAVGPVLGSRSTCLAAGFGGLSGRALRAGDVVATGEGRQLEPPATPVPPGLHPAVDGVVTLRLTHGPQASWLPREGWETLLGEAYTVSGASDRMGLRLEGCPPAGPALRELVSEGVPPGAVQIPPSGQPILLLADRQTTGGYPKPAVLAAVDLPLAAQLLPGTRVRFCLIEIGEARRLLAARERLLAAWSGRARDFRFTVSGRSYLVTVEELDR